MSYLFYLLWIVVWVCGVVIAKGFWSTFFAVLTYGWWSFYLVTEVMLKYYGVIQ